jgi:hypothetical protein
MQTAIIFEALATASVVVGVIFTALDMRDYYMIANLSGCFLWRVTGIYCKKHSIIWLNVFLITIYLYGIIFV